MVDQLTGPRQGLKNTSCKMGLFGGTGDIAFQTDPKTTPGLLNSVIFTFYLKKGTYQTPFCAERVAKLTPFPTPQGKRMFFAGRPSKK